jgi:dTDP-4-amino-4,6-dideoxygalactose transaminase
MIRISVAKPCLDASEEEAVIRVLRSGWISAGPAGEAFEKALASFVGVQHARAVNSGTSAILLALLACGVGAGDEVIVPAFTCVATLNPIEQIGARPVPVDIEPNTYALDPAALARAVTEKTKALLAVHLFGLPAPMDAIFNAIPQNRIKVIEDAALGLGGRIQGRQAGSFGTAAILSFHPRKLITTGEGGMVLTDSPEIDARVASLRNYGADVQAWERHQGKLYSLPEYRQAGFNSKLSDVLAAIGLEQVKKLPAILRSRKELAERYHSLLSGIAWLAMPFAPDGFEHAYQSFVVRIRTKSVDSAAKARERLFAHLHDNGIAAVQGAQSMAAVSYYRDKYGWIPGNFPNALLADQTTLALPIYPNLLPSEQDRVVGALRSFSP